MSMLGLEDMEQWAWHIGNEQMGERIDKFITNSLGDDISRSQVQQWIKDGYVQVNNKVVKANYILLVDDHVVVCIPVPVELALQAEAIPLDVIYEDIDLIIINKPRGMVVHPAPGHQSGTVVNALLYHYGPLSGMNNLARQGIVHRIDKDTSGLLMVAKTEEAQLSLAAQLKERTVIRKYKAIVHGEVVHDQGTIDAPIGRDAHDRKLFAVTNTGSKEAITHFVVAQRLDSYTLLELKLETGRTHQIRVHMKFIGHPLVGDPTYGRNRKQGKSVQMKGQALHATALGFIHPRSGNHMEFELPLPEDMEHVLDFLHGK